MQVYTWRQGASEVNRYPKRPFVPWTQAEIGGLPAHKEATRRVFDSIVERERKQIGVLVVRLGICSHPSPDVGVYRQGMAELSRRTMGDRVEITWLRGLWESLHFLYGTQDLGDARALCTDLIRRAERRHADPSIRQRIDIRLAGNGQQHGGPFMVYMAMQKGGVSFDADRVPFGAIARGRAAEAEASGRDGPDGPSPLQSGGGEEQI